MQEGNPLESVLCGHICRREIPLSLCTMYVHMQEGNPLESMYNVCTYAGGKSP